MAQIIKHRRGTLESLIAVTGSLLKGELVIATGSTNLAPANGESVVFIAPADGRVEAVNRIMRGADAPNTFAAGTYNGIMEGVPYYASSSTQTPTLFLLGSGVNEAIDLIGNIQPFSTSVDSRLDAVEASIGGGGNVGNSITLINSFTASALSRFSNLEIKSASVDNSVSLINLYTSSQDTKNTTLSTYTSSVNDKFTTLATYTSSVNTKWTTLENVTSSILIFTGSTNSRLSNIELTSASILPRIDSLEVFSGSQNTKNTTLQNYTSSLDAKLSTLSTYTSSVDDKLTNLINKTGSYATTGSGTYYGTQVFSGSVYIQNDLIVLGSSSISNISASSVSIGDNQILLNTFTPAIRFGGISVIDSGSTGGTGSLWWDSVNNHWLYEHPADSEAAYNSAMLIAGPKNTGNLGEEVGLTSGKLTVAVGSDHISSSQISDDGATVTIPGALSVGTLVGIGVVSTFSTSVDSRLDAVEASLGGGGAISTRVASLEQFTSSQDTKNSTLATYTGSVDTKFTTLANVTASLNQSTASQQNSIDLIGQFTSSQDTKNSTLATYTGSVDTKFITLATYTGSVDTKFTTLANVTASLNQSTASQQNSIDLLGSFSASENTKNTTLATYTGSVDTKFTTLATYTSSIDTKFSTLASTTASLLSETNNLELFTSSQETKNSTLATYTGSVNTKFGTLATYTGSVDNSLSLLNSYSASLKNVFTLAGSDVTVAGNATITGDLTVQGNTVTFNATTLVVEDKLIELASGSTNATQANGAGISIIGANATLTYESTRDAWTFNKPLSGSAFTGSVNVPGGSGSKRIAFRGTTDNIEFVAAPTTNGDLVQWNGSDFVMSNVIDGGSF